MAFDTKALLINQSINQKIPCLHILYFTCRLLHSTTELAWRSGSVMDCHATARGFNSRWERCIYRASHPSQGTVNGSAVSKRPRCRWDVKHNQPTNTLQTFFSWLGPFLSIVASLIPRHSLQVWV